MEGSALTVLFWNIIRRARPELVAVLAAEQTADVVILAESGAENDAVLETLRKNVHDSFSAPDSLIPRLQIFSRHRSLDLREVYGDLSRRVTIRVLRFQGKEFLLVAAHLPDKRYFGRVDQAAEAQQLSLQIRHEEERQGHTRTIVIGDLNMNPFEDGIVQAAGLHAMMTKATAAAGSRIVQGREYPFFYNPMWGFFGDQTNGPPGTFYYRDPAHLSYEWNIFDQVLIRPAVLPWFNDDVAIVTIIGATALTDAQGRPNQEVGSDHFPLVFRLAALK